MKTVIVCGRPGSCCPTVDIPTKPGEKHFIIRDDEGGIVKLTKEQYDALPKGEN